MEKFLAKGAILDCRKEEVGPPATVKTLANVAPVRTCHSPRVGKNRNRVHIKNANYKKLA